MRTGLVIRVDGDRSIGAGHVMRCLALVEQWRCLRRSLVTVVGRLEASLAQRLTAAGCQVVDTRPLEDDVALLSRLRPAWAVVDGYSFDSAFLKRWRKNIPRLLVIDDLGQLPAYPVDCILNQNLSAQAEAYYGRTAARLLLGPRYALLRGEFSSSTSQPHTGEVSRLLVTLGGGDNIELTGRVLAALASVTDRPIHLRVTSGYAHGAQERLKEITQGFPWPCDILEPDVDMAPQFRWADAAVTAGGVTLLELLAMGVPCAVLVMADNQRANVDAAGEVVHVLGNIADLDDSNLAAGLSAFLTDGTGRLQRAVRGKALVDCKGARRVVAAMTSMDLELRPVSVADGDLLLAWANDSVTRANSFRSQQITPEEHRQWLEARCQDPSCWMWLAETPGGTPLGVIRFETQADGCVLVSFTVAPEWRGIGLGAPLLNAACQRLAAIVGTVRLVAMVRPENLSSLTVFTRAGFREIGETKVNGVAARRLLWEHGKAAPGTVDYEEVADVVLYH